MNVKIGTEAVPFPEKEYVNGIFVAVCIAQTFFALGHSLPGIGLLTIKLNK
jgi:hypothetical protein